MPRIYNGTDMISRPAMQSMCMSPLIIIIVEVVKLMRGRKCKQMVKSPIVTVVIKYMGHGVGVEHGRTERTEHAAEVVMTAAWWTVFPVVLVSCSHDGVQAGPWEAVFGMAVPAFDENNLSW